MKRSVFTGVTFGLTSGVMTTLGLVVGLHAGTHSLLAIVGGIATIAVADACSDALGIHITEESRKERSSVEVWEATAATFVAKFVVALTFVLPVVLLPLPLAIPAAVAWGLLLLAGLSVHLAFHNGTSPWKVVTEHLLIACLIVGATHLTGEWIARVFA